jgi:hypothetical protein
MAENEVPGAESLTDDELAAVVRGVQALVDKDVAVLREVGAYDYGRDPYLYTRHWLLWDHVDLVRRPGDPRTWQLDVFRGEDNLGAALDIEMWTEQEGRSELTRQIDLMTDVEGAPKARFGDLHVM